ncbi:MAG: hypothetical protein ACP59X_01635 [Solidesulfovibrio sp. DCME]|uniref:hypothetical protein n=1 Tax=Solidesulfovibrio sp. DCME TaxID=3447380 RepID=UPI003D12F265
MRKSTCLFILLAFVSGCGPIVKTVPLSKAISQGKDNGVPTTYGGLPYFLPKTVFHIVSKPLDDTNANGNQTTDTSKKQAVASKTAKSKSKKSGSGQDESENAAAAKPSTKKPDKATDNPEASAPTTPENKDDDTEKKQVAAVSASHDIEFSYYNSELGKQCQFTLDLVTVPDPNYMFFLRLTPHPASEDTLTIAVKDGFLSTVTTSTKDESAEIIKKSVEIVKQAVLLGAGVPGPASVGGPAAAKGTTLAATLDLLVEPADLMDSDFAKRLPSEISLSLAKLGNPPAKPAGDSDSNTPPENSGICYRAALPYKLEVQVREVIPSDRNISSNTASAQNKKNKKGKIEKTAHAALKGKTDAKVDNKESTPPSPKKSFSFNIQRYVMMPNDSPVFTFDIERAAFVKNTYDLKLNDGFLTSVNMTKPSQVLAGLSLPLDIIKSIASIPTEIIQLKFNYSSKQEALLELQQKRFETLQAFNQAILAMYQENATNTQAIIEKVNSMKQ